MHRFEYPVALLFCICMLLACSDQTGTEYRADDGPGRIVVISPAIAEMIEQLGLADRVVGRGQFGPWSADIEKHPVVGGYDNPNVEQVMQLGAEAVLNVKSQASVPAHMRLEKAGIEVIELDTATFEGVFASLEELGARFNRQQQAQQIRDRLVRELNSIQQQAQGLSKRRVLFVAGREPLFVAGPGSHVDYMINLVGGTNIAGDAHAPWQQISMETILERQPEVIIDSSLNHVDAIRGRQSGDWQQWPFLPAVENNRVYWIDPSQVVIPGIRMVEMTRLMGKLVHPEVFGEPQSAEYLAWGTVHAVP